LRDFIPECDRLGITLAIENHDRFQAAALREIFDRVAHPRVGLCFDTANSLGCMEGAEHVLAVLGPHIVNVHVKDVSVARLSHNFGFVVEGRPAGAGQLDIPSLLGRVCALGRDPNVILELWPPPEATLAATIEKENAWVSQSVRYLRQFISD
jgi:sugar phosphate isomerase/epimerase